MHSRLPPIVKFASCDHICFFHGQTSPSPPPFPLSHLLRSCFLLQTCKDVTSFSSSSSLSLPPLLLHHLLFTPPPLSLPSFSHPHGFLHREFGDLCQFTAAALLLHCLQLRHPFPVLHVLPGRLRPRRR